MKFTKEFRTGLIIIITFFVFWETFQFLKGKDIFQKQMLYYFILDEVTGLEKSTPVTISGLKVGRIKDIEPIIRYGKDITFKVSIYIDKKFLLPCDSNIDIYEPTIMSAKELRILLGHSKKKLINNQKIISNRKPDFNSAFRNEISPLKIKTDDILFHLNQTLCTTRLVFNNLNYMLNEGNKSKLHLFLNSFYESVFHLEKTSRLLYKFVGDNKSNVSLVLNDVRHLIYSSDRTLEKIKMFIDKIDQIDILNFFNKLDSSLNSLSIINNIVQKVSSNEGSLGKIINDDKLYYSFINTSNKIDKLITDLQKHPKKYFHFSILGKN